MRRARIVTVSLLLEVDDEAEACDGTNELLRGLQKDFTDNTCLVDYAINETGEELIIPDDYEEGSAFYNPPGFPAGEDWEG